MDAYKRAGVQVVPFNMSVRRPESAEGTEGGDDNKSVTLDVKCPSCIAVNKNYIAVGKHRSFFPLLYYVKTEIILFFIFFFLFSTNNKDTASRPRFYIPGLPECQPLSTLNPKKTVLKSTP